MGDLVGDALSFHAMRPGRRTGGMGHCVHVLTPEMSRWSEASSRTLRLAIVSGVDDHFRRLERMYHGAAINRFFAPKMTVSDGRALVAMTVRPDFFHAAHAVHGAVYFKALDDAAFFAANSAITDVFVLTVSFNVVLVRPVTEGTITATGVLVHKSRNLLVAEAELLNDRDRIVARGTGTFALSKIPLDEKVGYV